MLKVDIVADAAGASKGAKEAESVFDGLGKKIVTLGAGLAVAAFGKESVEAASKVQQSFGALDAVFKNSSGVMKQYAKDAANSVGLSKGAYAELSTTLGATLKNQGVAQGDLAKQTQDLIKRGADLASMFGGTTADAVDALSSAFRGEADPAERYGLNLSQTAVAAYQAAHASENLTQQQARMALIMTQSKDAAGNFAKESNTLEGTQQRLQAKVENLQASLGTALLPVLTLVAGVVSGVVVPAFSGSWDWIQRNRDIVLLLVGVIGGAILVYKTYTTTVTIVNAVTKAWTVVQAALNLELSLNPIGIVVIAIAALTAGVILAYKNCGWFRDAVNVLWDWLKRLWSVGQDVVRIALTPMRIEFGLVRDVIGFVGDKLRPVLDLIKNIAVPAALGALRDSFNGIKDAVQFVIDKVKEMGDLLSHIPGAGVIKNIVGKSASASPDAYALAGPGRRRTLAVGYGAVNLLPTFNLSVSIDGQQLQGRIDYSVSRAMNRDGARLMAGAWS
ncbi:hypothetical protein KGQ20_13915 [Catenulispora sp. NF23]|uniref:hypothetical protein n=1 Tax=Catenulispora pinistramenti TaxID=2705254 RepID=UPI001BA828D0|nr:hypothetical protein [Catenulispora pinistramenti]MBS2533865.1 hypothetical protein [Catenulispora pinistramenti]